jgi:hypothetical protein
MMITRNKFGLPCMEHFLDIGDAHTASSAAQARRDQIPATGQFTLPGRNQKITEAYPMADTHMYGSTLVSYHPINKLISRSSNDSGCDKMLA